VVVDPGDDLALGTVGEQDAAHHVHLPQLHGTGVLPALVVVQPAPPGLGVDQPVADQAAVDRGPGGRLGEFSAQLGQDGSGAPARMGSAHGHDPGLDLGGDLVGTPIRPGAAVRERPEALGGVANQPSVDGAPVDPVAGGDVGDPGTVQGLPHREVTLLNHRQLREHVQILLGSSEPK
jgi:hypothetical protein